MNSQELEQRTKVFALGILKFLKTFKRDKAGDVLAFQLVKSATSIGANYREACRASTHNDFIHKISIVEKEAAETKYWLELCVEGEIGNLDQAKAMLDESSQLLAIFTASGRSAKANRGVRDDDGTTYLPDVDNES